MFASDWLDRGTSAANGRMAPYLEGARDALGSTAGLLRVACAKPKRAMASRANPPSHARGQRAGARRAPAPDRAS